MANNVITLEDCRGYATEENLRKGLKRLGLDDWRENDHAVPCRYVICRKPDGKWTAIFMVTEFVNRCGGCYVARASQHGFMSV